MLADLPEELLFAILRLCTRYLDLLQCKLTSKCLRTYAEQEHERRGRENWDLINMKVMPPHVLMRPPSLELIDALNSALDMPDSKALDPTYEFSGSESDVDESEGASESDSDMDSAHGHGHVAALWTTWDRPAAGLV